LTVYESKASPSKIQIKFSGVTTSSLKLKDIDLGTSTAKIEYYELKIIITNPLVYTSYLKLKSSEIIFDYKPTPVNPEIIESETYVDFSKLKVNFPELRVTIPKFPEDQIHITTQLEASFYS
jgi:hypothetical protein